MIINIFIKHYNYIQKGNTMYIKEISTLCTLSALAFQYGCAQKSQNDLNKKLEHNQFYNSFSSTARSLEHKNKTKEQSSLSSLINSAYDNIKNLEIPYEELKNVDDIINYIETSLKLFAVKIEIIHSSSPMQRKKIEPHYRITSTLYPEPIEFNTLTHLHQKLQIDVYNHLKATRIQNFEKEYQVQIKPLLGHHQYTFELTAHWLTEKMFFKDLGSLEAAVKNGYHIQNTDNITKIFRILRNKNFKNVSTLSPFHSQKAFVIDGADDLATAMESSGLSQKLIYAIQGVGFYPAFLYLVHSGTEGASAQHNALKQEVKELLLQSYEQELKIKQTIRRIIENKTDSNFDIQHIYLEQINFKINILKLLNELYYNKNENIIKKTILFLTNEIEKTKSLKSINSLQLMDLPKDIRHALNEINKMPEFDLKDSQSIEFISQLTEFKNSQEDVIKTYIAQKIPGALTEGGLMSMFSGMAAFEIRAILGFAHLELFTEQLKNKTQEQIQNAIKDSSFLNDFTNIKDAFIGNTAESLFAGTLGILTKLGDGFLALGQAQMFLGGLLNISYGIDELKSLRDWTKIVESSELWQHTNTETQKLRTILANFYKKQSLLTLFKTTGDIMLTTGQFAMLMGGPLAFETLPATVGGASATILGVATKQTFEKIIELYYEFENAPDASIEAKIITGELDNPGDPALEKIAKRIENLNQLTIQRSKLRVWQKLYLEIQNRPKLHEKLKINPNYIEEKILPTLRRNFLSGAKYQHFYLNALNELFPNPTSNKNKIFLNNNLNYLKKAAEYIYAAHTDNNSLLLFHRFTIQHLAELKKNIDNPEKNFSHLSANNIDIQKDFSKMSMKDIAQEIKLVFEYLSLLGIDSEFEHKIVSRIIKGEGSLFNDNNLLHLAQEYISLDKTNIIANKTKSSLFAGTNSIASLYKNYYFPFLDLTPIKKNLENIIFTSENKNKEKIIYFFDKEKFLNDLEFFENLTDERKIVLTKLLREIFIIPPDESKFKSKFGHDKRSPIKKIMEGIYSKITRQETLRPVLKYTLPQLELYDMMKSVMGLTNNSPNIKLIYAKKMASQIINGMNQANILVNFYHLPSRIMNIHEQNLNGEYFNVARNSLEITLDNADLVIDLVRGSSLLHSHAHMYKNIGRTQAALNIATAGFEVWNAVDMLRKVPSSTGKEKQDYIFYGTTSTLSAATSIGTLAALPLTSMAGPVGTAIGFSIMLGQNIYTSIRTHEELVHKFGMPPSDAGKLGAAKLGCPMCDVSKSLLFEPYQRDFVKKQELSQHLRELNKSFQQNNIFFMKLVTPNPYYYFPVTPKTYSTSNCGIAGCSVSSTGGYVLKEGIHLCQTNNSYNTTNNKISNELLNKLKLTPYNTEHKKYFLQEQKRIKELSFWQKIFVSYDVYDFTRYCKEENINNYKIMDEYFLDDPLFKNIDPRKKATLFYVGLDDQYKHGYALSHISGDLDVINYFIVEKGQYKYTLLGGNKDDYFELKAPSIEAGLINGKEGFNLINLQNFEFNAQQNDKNKITFVSQSTAQLNQDLTKLISINSSFQFPTANIKNSYQELALHLANTSNKNLVNSFPLVENISHFLGSKYKDIYLGNSFDEVIVGNKGNDTLIGGLGDDILAGGEDIDTLVGGAGRDTYLINKSDYLNSKENYDIIYFANRPNEKYYSPYFFSNNDNERDIIITDIYQLGIFLENSDLWFVSNDKDILTKRNDKHINFVKLFKLENFKENEKILKNLPIITTKDGHIIAYDATNVTTNITWLNTIASTSHSHIDTNDIFNIPQSFKEKKGIRLDKNNSYADFSFITGNMNSEILIGNQKDNYINASYGNAFIQGLGGNDILIAYLDHSKKENIVIMDGGIDDDLFMVNITDYNYYSKDNIPIIRIIDEEKFTNGNLVVKILGNYPNLNYKSFFIGNEKTLHIRNNNNEILFKIELANSLTLNSIQVEIGNSPAVKLKH